MLRVMGKTPDVYIQALSGGTGPFAVEKAFADLEGTGLADKLPRLLLAQGDRCAPQAQAWAKAKAENFPEGYEKEYPIIEKPRTINSNHCYWRAKNISTNGSTGKTIWW
jgi:threonine synthase